MAFTVDLDMEQLVEFKCDYDKAFETFMNVEKMAFFNPNLEKIEEIGDNKYTCTMKKAGVSKYSMQVIYAAEYNFDKENGKISWTPIEGIGNGLSSGSITVKKLENSVEVDFLTKLTLDIPFSKLAKAIITPFVKKEFRDSIEKINDSVKNELEG